MMNFKIISHLHSLHLHMHEVEIEINYLTMDMHILKNYLSHVLRYFKKFFESSTEICLESISIIQFVVLESITFFYYFKLLYFSIKLV